MRAAAIHAIGRWPHTETVGDPPSAYDGKVVIQVQAAALNSIDLHIAAGDHRAGKPQLPYVPECVGVIIEALMPGYGSARWRRPGWSPASTAGSRSFSRSTARPAWRYRAGSTA